MGLLEEAGIRVPKFRLAESADQAYQIAASQGWSWHSLHGKISLCFGPFHLSRAGKWSGHQSTDSRWWSRQGHFWHRTQRWCQNDVLVRILCERDRERKYFFPRPNEAKEIASKMLGHRLYTKQTGREGKPVSKLIMCEKLFTRREYYFACKTPCDHRERCSCTIIGYFLSSSGPGTSFWWSCDHHVHARRRQYRGDRCRESRCPDSLSD